MGQASWEQEGPEGLLRRVVDKVVLLDQLACELTSGQLPHVPVKLDRILARKVF